MGAALPRGIRGLLRRFVVRLVGFLLTGRPVGVSEYEIRHYGRTRALVHLSSLALLVLATMYFLVVVPPASATAQMVVALALIGFVLAVFAVQTVLGVWFSLAQRSHPNRRRWT